MGDRDEHFFGSEQDDLVLRRLQQTEYKSHRRWEQMECEFLLGAHRERGEIIALS